MSNPSEAELQVGEALKAQRERINETLSGHKDLAQALARLHCEIHATDTQPIGAVGPLELELWDDWGGREVYSYEALVNRAFADGDWTGLHHSKDGGALDEVRISNVSLLHMEKWASRMYRVRSGNIIKNVTVASVLCEHGFYFNLAGYNGEIPLGTPSVTWRGCLFRDIGSQAIQVVDADHRRDETPFPDEDSTPGGPLIVEDCRLENVGFNLGGNARASYALSFFACPNDVRIRRTTLDNRCQRESRGCVLIEGSALAGPGGGEDALIEDCRFLMGETDRPLAKIGDRKRLVIRRSHFSARGGQNRIQIDGCESVSLRDCTGNARVRVDGQDLGEIGSLTLG